MTQANLNSLFASYNIIVHLKRKFNYGSKTPITISDAMSTIRSFEIFDQRTREVGQSEVRYAIHLSRAVTNFSKKCLDTLVDFANPTEGSEDEYLEEKVRAYLLDAFQNAEEAILGLAGLISGEMMVEGTYESIPDQLKSFTQLGIEKYKEQRAKEELEDAAVDMIDDATNVTREAIQENVEDLTNQTLDEMPEDVETVGQHSKASSDKATPRQIISSDINKI